MACCGSNSRPVDVERFFFRDGLRVSVCVAREGEFMR